PLRQAVVSLLGGPAPQPYRAMVAAAGQGLAVGADRHRGDRVAVAGEGLPIWRWVATSHSTVPSPSPVARVWPSGLNATEPTPRFWPVGGLPIWWWVATSHHRTVRSSPLARGLPSGLNATHHTSSPPTPAGGGGGGGG